MGNINSASTTTSPVVGYTCDQNFLQAKLGRKCMGKLH
jgi:hypothetical protein